MTLSIEAVTLCVRVVDDYLARRPEPRFRCVSELCRRLGYPLLDGKCIECDAKDRAAKEPA